MGQSQQINFFLLRLANPTDPAHVQSSNLKYDQSFVKFSSSVGSCHPLVKFPKNPDGSSFHVQWYNDDPWLEYSPLNDAMYCFSVRNFMNDERFWSRTGWKSVGINLWRQAKVKIKEHRSSELHMLSMIRWHAFTKDTLKRAFALADSQMEAAKELPRQNNREIMFGLIDITLFLAKQALAFRGNEEGLSSLNRRNCLSLVDLLGQYDSVLGLHLHAVKEKRASNQRCHVSLLSNRTQNNLIKALSLYVKRIIQNYLTKTTSAFKMSVDRDMTELPI